MNFNKKYTLEDILAGQKLAEGGMYAEGGEIEESIKYYTKEGYITTPSIDSKEGLITTIELDIQEAWDEFRKTHKIEYKGDIVINEGRNNKTYIELEGEKITGKDLGVFKHGLQFAHLYFFGGGEIRSVEIGDKFYFSPVVGVGLSIRYEVLDRGSNGVSYMVDRDKNGHYDNWIFYSILDRKWYTRSEWIKKYKSND